MNGPNQTVISQSRETLVLELRRQHPEGSSLLPVALTEANREFLEPNAYIQSDDPEAKSLAREVVGGEKDVFKAALRLERWVAENMKFDLGIVFAPSSEVLKNKRGTCVGYATLLATLTRAAGIPSRVVMGYVYVEGMFGGHAWTEVLVGKEWIPIDAAVVAAGPADASRLAFIRSSLRGGVGSLQAGPGQQMFGQIGIRILEYETAGGKRVSVPQGAKPYVLKGDVYENPWIGLAISKPPGFAFSRLDEVWPDATVVGMDGPKGVRVTLREAEISPWTDPQAAGREILAKLGLQGKEQSRRLLGRDSLVVEGLDKAAAAIPGPGELWILSVEGADASRLLGNIASTLQLPKSEQ